MIRLFLSSLFLVLFSHFLGGCALYSIGPNAYVESPENIHSEKGHAEAYLRAVPAQDFHLANNAAARPLTVTNPPDLRPSYLLMGGAQFSVSDRWELGLSGSPIDGVFFLRGLSFAVRPSVKYQLLGDTGEKAMSIGSRLSLFSNVAWTHISLSGSQREFFGEGGYPWKATSDFAGVTGGVSYGYRWNMRWLTYAGYSAERFQVDGSIHQNLSNTGDYPEADYSFPKTLGTSQTVALGAYYGVHGKLQIVYSYSLNQWGGFENRQHFLTIGLSSLGFSKKGMPTVEPYKVQD